MGLEMSQETIKVKRTKFYFNGMKIFLIVHGFLEDFVAIFFLIIINCFILMTIKQSVKKKKKYHVNPSNYTFGRFMS